MLDLQGVAARSGGLRIRSGRWSGCALGQRKAGRVAGEEGSGGGPSWTVSQAPTTQSSSRWHGDSSFRSRCHLPPTSPSSSRWHGDGSFRSRCHLPAGQWLGWVRRYHLPDHHGNSQLRVLQSMTPPGIVVRSGKVGLLYLRDRPPHGPRKSPMLGEGAHGQA